MSTRNAVERRLRAAIARDGPISLAAYMNEALLHEEHGYYRTRDPLGADGDFTTAPEVSQIFGELIGLWLAQCWIDAGRPSPCAVIELGPGRGALMADALRAARAAPGFLEAARVTLVEISEPLRQRQRDRLAGATPHPIVFAKDLLECDATPTFVVANEFFDALPIRQFVRRGSNWLERRVGLDADGDRFAFVDSGAPVEDRRIVEAIERRFHGAPEGALFELNEWGAIVASTVGALISANGGGALIVDYGYTAADRAAAGGRDTFQAARAHKFADPFESPGDADLTAHVDFTALADAAAGEGARAYGPIGQGSLLRRLGAEARAAALARANPARVDEIARGLHRLIDPAEMGTLFRALALTGPDAAAPPGFEETR